jgi:hypothetical protein
MLITDEVREAIVAFVDCCGGQNEAARKCVQ